MQLSTIKNAFTGMVGIVADMFARNHQQELGEAAEIVLKSLDNLSDEEHRIFKDSLAYALTLSDGMRSIHPAGKWHSLVVTLQICLNTMERDKAFQNTELRECFEVFKSTWDDIPKSKRNNFEHVSVMGVSNVSPITLRYVICNHQKNDDVKMSLIAASVSDARRKKPSFLTDQPR